MAGARAALPGGGVLAVVCGLPGSGKTSLARRLARERGLVRLCADDWMEELGMSLWDLDARARVETVQRGLLLELLDAPDEELWRRIAARDREDPPISLADVRTWREFFEAPGPEELALFDAAPVALRCGSTRGAGT